MSCILALAQIGTLACPGCPGCKCHAEGKCCAYCVDKDAPDYEDPKGVEMTEQADGGGGERNSTV